MSTRLTIVRLVAVAGLSVSLTACGKLSAQKSFKDGINAYQQQNYREAITELTEAVEHDFEYRPYAYFYLANSHDNAFKYSRKGQPENDAHLPEAEKYYKLAYEQIDPASREGQGAIFKKRALEYLVGVYGKEKMDAPDKAEAVALLDKAVRKYEQLAPKLARWLEQNIPEGLTVFGLEPAHRRLLRTTNGLERLNKEVRRRTAVVGIFPNEASCLRLVTALLMETSEEWELGRAYLTFA